MSKIANFYSDEIKKHFKVLFANWEPGGPVALGDYGELVGNIFVPRGNLINDFPEFNADDMSIKSDNSLDHKEYWSESSVEVALTAKGSISPSGATATKAQLDIKFSKQNAVFFNASKCKTNRLVYKSRIGEKLIQLYQRGAWEKKWVVLTDLVNSGSTIIAISQSNNASLTLEAESDAVQRINLADVSAKLSMTAQRSIGYKVVTDEGMDLLLGLCKIRIPFLNEPTFDTHAILGPAIGNYKIKEALGAILIEDNNQLIFSQIGFED